MQINSIKIKKVKLQGKMSKSTKLLTIISQTNMSNNWRTQKKWRDFYLYMSFKSSKMPKKCTEINTQMINTWKNCAKEVYRK